jgi:hypothetical protein
MTNYSFIECLEYHAELPVSVIRSGLPRRSTLKTNNTIKMGLKAGGGKIHIPIISAEVSFASAIVAD